MIQGEMFSLHFSGLVFIAGLFWLRLLLTSKAEQDKVDSLLISSRP